MSRIWRVVRRLTLALVGLIMLLVVAGACYQWLSVRAETGWYPPPGRLVDIGGRRLHFVCLGSHTAGDPTVIFESSGFGSSLSARRAREEIAAHARVCSYDRMGMAWSDPGPAAIPTSALVSDLEQLLVRAGIPPPYVIVPASIGGFTAELFARRHPDQTAGLVFVDAVSSDALFRFEPMLTSWRLRSACLMPMAARLGVLRALDPMHMRGQMPAEDAARGIALLYSVKPMETFCGLVSSLATSVGEFRTAPPLAPDVPLVVLTAGIHSLIVPPGYRAEAEVIYREWPAVQQQLARRSTRGSWRLVPDATHLIGNSQPHVVAEAVLEVLAQIRRR